jgi:hypothetical protein
MQTGSTEALIGGKSGKTTHVPLWDRIEGAWLWTQMQGGENWILAKEINADRFFGDSHWLEIWKNQLCPSMGLNGQSVISAS